MVQEEYIMNFKEYLVSTGISEEQAQQVVDGMPEKDFHLASEENLDVRFEKMKQKKEELETDLATANETLTTLRDENKDVQTLQEQIEEYESTVATLQEERAEEQKSFAIKEALTKAGAKDLDYMMFKLGDVEVDEEGNLKNLDNKLKELKENNPTFFTESEQEGQQENAQGGYQPFDNGLGDEQLAKTFSMEEISKLTPEEINQNWDAVSASLEKGED